MAKNDKDSDQSVYIGTRPIMNYVMAVMVILNEQDQETGKAKHCTIKARGKRISRAVDVAEILKKKFVTDAEYVDIRLSTEQLKNADGKVSNVSSIEIEIAKK